MTELEMFQERIQGNTIQRTPGAVQVLAGLCLLSAVVVVQELIHYLQSLWLIHLAPPSTAPTATIVVTPTAAVPIANTTVVVVVVVVVVAAAVIASLCYTKIIHTN
jgi:hypothetical protein